MDSPGNEGQQAPHRHPVKIEVMESPGNESDTAPHRHPVGICFSLIPGQPCLPKSKSLRGDGDTPKTPKITRNEPLSPRAQRIE